MKLIQLYHASYSYAFMSHVCFRYQASW